MENKENYNEPLYENLKLFNGLELVYRHPCLHLHSENMECANCKYGLSNNCVVHNEYLKIKKYLKILDILKSSKIDLWDFVKDIVYFDEDLYGRTAYEWYSMHYREFSLEKLNREEFALIVGWFNEKNV